MMKKIFFLCVAVVCVTAQAEVFTLDLTTATDMQMQPVQYQTENEIHYRYSIRNVWDSTYSDSWVCAMIYCNYAKFMFSHTPSKASYGGTSWEGFTLSKVASDTLNPFACVAKGGVEGEGTPFLIGYYSEYYTNNNTDGMPSSNMVYFDNEYYPQEVQICQNVHTLKAITEGLSPARAFTDKDTLTLVISSLDALYQEGKSVEYHLAVDGAYNKGWSKVDISSIGKCMGLSFRMKSTDAGQWGINTPTYFAMDGLKISDVSTATDNTQCEVSNAQCSKMMIDGQVVIVRDGVKYNVLGVITGK